MKMQVNITQRKNYTLKLNEVNITLKRRHLLEDEKHALLKTLTSHYMYTQG